MHVYVYIYLANYSFTAHTHTHTDFTCGSVWILFTGLLTTTGSLRPGNKSVLFTFTYPAEV